MTYWCRVFLAVIFTCFLSDASGQSTVGEFARVKTKKGILLGERVEGGGVEFSVFRGVPYALPPVGLRRWRPAEPMQEAWQGERLATHFAPACFQSTWENPSTFYYMPEPQMSEDCLYLNIWMPELDQNEDYPVMVWIHGGGLLGGASSSPFYDGAELAKKGVIVVSINYRLGVFGYLAHNQLSEESPKNASGNYGLSDQIQALRWIQQNIEAFGGDPDRVTLFGESAGAYSVQHLLVSPLAKGLFHGAIIQSGYMPALRELKKGKHGMLPAEDIGTQLSDALKRLSIEGLRSIPAETVQKAADGIGFFPDVVIDGWLIERQLYETFEKGLQHDVPVVVGFNSGEGYHFGNYPDWLPATPKSPEDYIASVKSRYRSLSRVYLQQYPSTDLREAVFAPIRDGFYGWPMEKIVRASSKQQSKAYFYYFDHAMSWSESMGMGVFHFSDVFFSFNNIEKYPFLKLRNWPEYEPTDADIKMGQLLSEYWVNFAKEGKPSTNDGPNWPAYSISQKAYMHFLRGKALPDKHLLPGMFELHEKIIALRRSRDEQWWATDIGLHAPILSKDIKAQASGE